MMMRATALLTIVLTFSAVAFYGNGGSNAAGDGVAEARGHFERSLDQLYAELAGAPDEKAAKRAEAKIRARWHDAAGPTITLLMARTSAAILDRDYAMALDLADSVIALEPNYAEAWSQRATIHYLQDAYGKALSDLYRALALQPRHFGALSDFGQILKTFGQKAEALEVFRRALELHPFLKGAQKAVKELEPEVDGREI